MTAPSSAPVAVCVDATAVPAFPGGAGRYVVDLTGSLRQRDDVHLSVLCRRDDDARWPGPATVAQAPGSRPLRLLWEQARLPGLLRRLGVDVHHGPHYTMPLRSPVPVVVTVHDLSLVEHPEWHHRSKVAFFGLAVRLAARRADALVAVSAATADRLASRLSPRAAISVIPHGVDHGRFHAAPAPGDAGTLARLGAVAPYVLFLGTLEPRKDVPSLVRAFGRMAPARPDLSLVLAGGPGWGVDAIEAEVASSAVAGRTHRTGYVPDADVAALLRGAAAVAYPSLDEGFGLPALEALACGAPLVTTTGSAMEEVVDDAALLVRPGDTVALAQALEALVDGGPDVARLRRRGPEVAAGYTWEASAAAHAAVYRSVV